MIVRVASAVAFLLFCLPFRRYMHNLKVKGKSCVTLLTATRDSHALKGFGRQQDHAHLRRCL